MSTTLVPSYYLEPSQSVSQMIQFAEQQPLLTSEEEQALMTRFYKHDDLQAAQKLILAHLRFVVRVAKGYSGYGLCLGDLIQEGTIGLMKAVKKFQPDHGVRLVTYAVHWIKAEIHDFILKNWRIVRVATTKAQKKLFFNLRRMKKNLHWLNRQEIKEIAQSLNVSEREVMNMEQRLSGADTSFELPDHEEGGEKTYPPVFYLGHDQWNPERLLTIEKTSEASHQQLEDAMMRLDARAKDIIIHRWLAENKMTLEELAQKYQISKERVRQIEQKALLFLKENLAETMSS